MRSGNGDSRALDNALETISAAATAIASTTGNRVHQDTVQVTCRREDGEAGGACIGVLDLLNTKSELGMLSLFLKQQPLELMFQLLKIQSKHQH